MEIKENHFARRGILKITKIETGEVLFEDSNLIVESSGQILSRLLSEGIGVINKIKVGTSDVGPTDQTRDALVGHLADFNTNNSYALNTATFDAVINTESLNGETIQEAGLFNDNIMFSREVHTPISKTNAFSLLYEWIIVF